MWKCPSCGNTKEFTQERRYWETRSGWQYYDSLLDENGMEYDKEYGDWNDDSSDSSDDEERDEVKCSKCGVEAVKVDKPTNEALIKIKEKVMQHG